MCRKWQVLVGVFLTLALVISLVAGCAPSAPAKQEWRLAQVHPVGSDHDLRMIAFAEEVRENTDGRIDITVYSGGTLGDWVENNEMVMRGALEMACVPTSPDYDPRLNIAYYLPYVVTSYEDARKVYMPGGLIYELTAPMFEGVGSHNLGFLAIGMSGCTLREVPPSPGDPYVAKNMKIRVMPLKMCEICWESLGYIPTAIPYAEAYTAIATGIVDGEMGGPPFQGYQFRDIQGCWIQYNEYVEQWCWIINKELWDGLSEGDQKIISEAANTQIMGRWDLIEAEDEEYRQEMKDFGLEIIMLTDEELEVIAEKVRRETWPLMEGVVGKAIMDEIYAALGIAR